MASPASGADRRLPRSRDGDPDGAAGWLRRGSGFRQRDEVLRKIAGMPISSWSYRDDERTVRRIGPTAQDFHAAFGLGDTDKAIATVDADGVALAAIKALEARSRAQEARIAALEAALAELQGESRSR